MSATPQPPTSDDQQETLILQSVDRFLEREVRPVVRELEAADTYPAAIADKLATHGALRRDDRARARRAGPPGAYLCAHDRAHVGGVDLGPRLHQFTPHHGGGGATLRHREQQHRWLPRFASGELRGGIG